MAAKALKARCLVYAASELNNLHGQSDWQNAAEACAEAIRIADQYGYDLVPFAEWNSNFYGTKYTNEHIWAWNYGSSKINTTTWSACFGYPVSNYTNASGRLPDAEFRRPLRNPRRRSTPDRNRPHYSRSRGPLQRAGPLHQPRPAPGQDDSPRRQHRSGMPVGRQHPLRPRHGNLPHLVAQQQRRTFGIAWGSNDLKGYSNTGYYVNKLWNGALGTSAAHQHTDPLIRMAELYLNYAEAVNEAYGPNGTAGGLALTATEAVNKIRSRAGMPDVLDKFTATPCRCASVSAMSAA